MKRIAVILPVFVILVLSYYRYTYFIFPNFSGEQVFIKIRQAAGLGDAVAPGGDANVRSILVYWALFLLGNTWFSMAVFRTRPRLIFVVGLYFVISGFSAVFFAVNALLVQSAFLVTMASMLKNLVLSPVFTAGCYIVLRYRPPASSSFPRESS
ncbi:MAG: hypothetical protein U5K79_19760 [Cyclobacteriaceae bacterium]|nr:hypothetical protein [Cyclobacteriaceae bacterium]